MPFNQLLDKFAAILIQPEYHFGNADGIGCTEDNATFVALMATCAAVLGLLFAAQDGVGVIGWIVGLVIKIVIAAIWTALLAVIIDRLAKFLGADRPYGDAFAIAAGPSALYPVMVFVGMLGAVGELLGLIWSWWIVSSGMSARYQIDRGSARIVAALPYALLLVVFWLS